MALKNYGVLSARAIDTRREGRSNTPHYQVHLVAGDETSFRIAVNVESKQSPSELLYLVLDDLSHPVTSRLGALTSGWHPLAPGPDGPNIDYIRANIVERALMRTLPPDAAGPDNDLADLFDHWMRRALSDPAAVVYAFGERWGPEAGVKDKTFGFQPGNGVHDIHMNQGNSRQFRGDDGVWQDGALIVHLPRESRWVGIFLAFQSQAWHTDDATGHAVGTAPRPDPDLGPGRPPVDGGAVRIVAALVNPIGPSPEAETVLLLNASPAPVDLDGWSIADKTKRTCPVPGGELEAGATRRVGLTDGVTLGNRGGIITLLDGAGLKVSGVAYTAEDARREGWTVTF